LYPAPDAKLKTMTRRACLKDGKYEQKIILPRLSAIQGQNRLCRYGGSVVAVSASLYRSLSPTGGIAVAALYWGRRVKKNEAMGSRPLSAATA
jgi:hypothetical protein